MFTRPPPPLETLNHHTFTRASIEVSVLRGDLVHPIISGNKAWKLKYNLIEAIRQHANCLLTFGGAFSNHLLAVAYAASEIRMRSIGIVRGDEPMDNRVLQRCREYGMEFIHVSRAAYRAKDILLQNLQFDRAKTFVIPEGGSNSLAVQGCAEVVPAKPEFDFIFVPVATSGTLAGFAVGAAEKFENCSVKGIAVLKGANFLEEETTLLAGGFNNWEILHDFHHGGFAKAPPKLTQFMADFSSATGVPLEPVYSGKLFFAVTTLASQNYFKVNSRILCVHTGGILLQQKSR